MTNEISKSRKKTKSKPKEKKEKKRKIWSVSFLLHLVVSSVYFIHSFLTHHTLREYTTTEYTENKKKKKKKKSAMTTTTSFGGALTTATTTTTTRSFNNNDGRRWRSETTTMTKRGRRKSALGFIKKKKNDRASSIVIRADAFNNLSATLDEAWAKMKGVADLSPENIKAPLKDVRRALLEADVSLPVVRRFIKKVEERAPGVKVTKGVEPSQELVKLVADELCTLMGGVGADGINFREEGNGPTVILMAGLQGVGKTTACGKLALSLKKQNKTCLLVATDVYRPAAIDQLKKLGSDLNVPVYDEGANASPPSIAANGVAEAKKRGDIDVVIVDTAGRLNIDEALMNELIATKMSTQADETLLVVDAMTGQEAATLTKSFADAIDITGAILTKLDGDTRGGAALSVREVSGKPIKFTGVGEKMDALDPFYPERMTSRILGMGDVVSFVEKAQEAVKQADAEQMKEKIMKATFDFDDFLKNMDMMGDMGSMSQLMKMIPGANKLSDKDMQEAEKSFKIAKSLIMSMTPEERKYPDMLVASSTAESRRNRIVKGAGKTEEDLAELIVMFGGMRVKMQQMSAAMGSEAAKLGLQPQLSSDEMTKLASEKVRKRIKPGHVRRNKAKKVPKSLVEREKMLADVLNDGE